MSLLAYSHQADKLFNMSEAGHYEALRKERILQRKREWDRLSGSAGINTPRTDQQFLSDANNQIVSYICYTFIFNIVFVRLKCKAHSLES